MNLGKEKTVSLPALREVQSGQCERRVPLDSVLAMVGVAWQRCFRDNVQDGPDPEDPSRFKLLIPALGVKT